jgi:hypothetical protein
VQEIARRKQLSIFVATNAAADGFYVKMGFETLQRETFEMPDGSASAEIILLEWKPSTAA